ncbi:MAG TPA: CBS domain-containing protein [Nitrososphaeraceae archaeon]|jgi:signal-transduction protein with cAMP-binding, CBS, and nucleotidyltransferase domain|nr:CBS domain-containing protein [Nitrososphaeraceae archaeon]
MYSTRRDQKIKDLVDKDIITIDESALISDSVRIMKDKGLSSIFVTRSGNRSARTPVFPIGIVTERDILYRVVAENKSPYKTTVREVMSAPVISIDEQATIEDTIKLMRGKNIRRLIVSKGERDDAYPIGVVTLMSIVGNVPAESLELAELESPRPGKTVETIVKIMCPYCGSKFQDKTDLSKHIDRIHVGTGLLEGDTRRW